MPLMSEIAGRLLRLPVAATRDLMVERDLRVPMDDGVVLYADRYAPQRTVRAPTVLVRSPYGRRGAFGFLFGRLLAERGLQVLVQSIRGTFGSGGRFDPFDERADGLATLRWLRARPWHSGPVGMIGPSYMGIVQWAIADQVDALAPVLLAHGLRRTLPRAYEHLPIGELDERAFGTQVAYFRDWMENLSPESPY